MDPWIALLAGTIGYLCGSISWARLVARWTHTQADITRIEHVIPGTDQAFVSDSVSATAVRMHVGTRYGCLTAILDMLKVALPTLAFRLWQPDVPYFLVVAAMGLVGHDLPVFHRFKGGRGESPIYGGLLVIAPVGIVVTNLIGFVLGVLVGNILVLRWAGMVLMIPWLWWRTQDWAYLAYILFVNLIYWLAMRPELQQYAALRGAGTEPSQEEIGGSFGMGRGLGRVLDNYNLRALWARWRAHSEKEATG